MRSFILYCLLVGIPVAGVSLVLDKGRTLTAPPAVWGEWKLEVPSISLPSRCAAGTALRPPGTLTIAQSGDRLTATFDDSGRSRLGGRLKVGIYEPTGIDASVDFELGDTAPGRVMSVHATFDRNVHPTSMRGTMGFAVCGTQDSVNFTAQLRNEDRARRTPQ